jgi:hypothetical protein
MCFRGSHCSYMPWVPRNLAMPLFLIWHPFCCLSELQADFLTTVSLLTNECEYFAFVSAFAISSADQKKKWIQQQCVALCYNWNFSPNSIGCFYANALWRLVYALCVKVDINLPQFLLLMFFFIVNPVDRPWILFVFMYPLGTSETFLCFTIVHF